MIPNFSILFCIVRSVEMIMIIVGKLVDVTDVDIKSDITKKKMSFFRINTLVSDSLVF